MPCTPFVSVWTGALKLGHEVLPARCGNAAQRSTHIYYSVSNALVGILCSYFPDVKSGMISINLRLLIRQCWGWRLSTPICTHHVIESLYLCVPPVCLYVSSTANSHRFPSPIKYGFCQNEAVHHQPLPRSTADLGYLISIVVR